MDMTLEQGYAHIERAREQGEADGKAAVDAYCQTLASLPVTEQVKALQATLEVRGGYFVTAAKKADAFLSRFPEHPPVTHDVCGMPLRVQGVGTGDYYSAYDRAAREYTIERFTDLMVAQIEAREARLS